MSDEDPFFFGSEKKDDFEEKEPEEVKPSTLLEKPTIPSESTKKIESIGGKLRSKNSE